jgi:type II secretory ATPase GspE/PulE/Tfp pilus assembly ATPase PilB-like protein
VGSGKTTTLYSCLSEIDRSRRQVVSIEDPVEIELGGVNQVEVNYQLGFDFVVGLRALLRQDPDVILVGEIRDDETAKIAVRASMTGLLVFTTLHTNDSTGAITALRNFQIPSHLIANSLQGSIAQRLLRKLCPHCKVQVSAQSAKKVTPEMLGLESLPKNFRHFMGKGCKSCFNTGYTGRSGVFEILTVDRTVRDMILDDASERSIRDYAVEHGLESLQTDGLEKVIQGVTSVEEFQRVLRF